MTVHADVGTDAVGNASSTANLMNISSNLGDLSTKKFVADSPGLLTSKAGCPNWMWLREVPLGAETLSF